MRTHIFVSRHYDAASNTTRFTHRVFGPTGWQYIPTLLRGNVWHHKL